MQAAARLLLLYYGVDRGVARIMLEAGLQAKAKSIPGKDLHRGCVPPRKVFFSVKLTRFVALLYTNGF